MLVYGTYFLFPDRAGLAGVGAGDGTRRVAEDTRHGRHESLPFNFDAFIR